jgi:hypothetical protein
MVEHFNYVYMHANMILGSFYDAFSTVYVESVRLDGNYNQ